MAWLEVYLQEQAENILRKNRMLFWQQLEVSRSFYASGRGKQQDVLQAELELSLLDDRLEDRISKKREARAKLSQWVGAKAAQWPLVTDSVLFRPAISDDLDELKKIIEGHPLVRAKQAKVDSARADVAINNEKYAPQWMFDVTYGKRDGDNMDGSERSDFLSAVVSLDIPLFTENRQDRYLSASKKQLQAARYAKQDALVNLDARLQQAYARWRQLETRTNQYDRDVLASARENAKAAFNGYQSGVVPFFTLTRVRSMELKIQLQRLQLEVKKAMTMAEIAFLAGEVQ
jgi:outer membrane protein TolC